MRRREFIALLGGSAIAWPFATSAQQSPMPVIGFLNALSPDGFTDRLRGFRQGLKDSGFVEGENLSVEYRWAENQAERLPSLAAELVRRPVALIVATGGSAPALAAKSATTTIPVVFGVPDEPVKLGLVTGLAQPNGNVTGIYFFAGDLVAKRFELLREMLPNAVRVALLVNPANPAHGEANVKKAESMAGSVGMQLQALNANSSAEINKAFDTLARERPDAFLVAPDPFFFSRRVQLSNLAARHAIPASYSVRDFVEVGGLMSYGTDITEAYRQVGVYAGRILKGAKPAALPVVQSTKFEIVINAQTATMLGLTVPQTLLARADEVIE